MQSGHQQRSDTHGSGMHSQSMDSKSSWSITSFFLKSSSIDQAVRGKITAGLATDQAPKSKKKS